MLLNEMAREIPKFKRELITLEKEDMIKNYSARDKLFTLVKKLENYLRETDEIIAEYQQRSSYRAVLDDIFDYIDITQKLINRCLIIYREFNLVASKMGKILDTFGISTKDSREVAHWYRVLIETFLSNLTDYHRIVDRIAADIAEVDADLDYEEIIEEMESDLE